MITLNIDSNSPDQTGFIPEITSGGTGTVGEYFSQDASMALWIRPVVSSTANPLVPWVDDYVAGDVYYLSIGAVDDRATGGTFTLTLTGAIAAQTYNVTAAALTTALSARSVTDGYGALTVTLLTEGVYQVDWSTMVAVPAMTASATLLTPDCQITVTQVRAGSGSTYAQQIIDIKQSAVATATVSTPYVQVAPSSTINTVPNSTTNAILFVSFGDAFDGFMTLTTVANGVSSDSIVRPGMTANEIGIALALHPEIYYQDAVEADNISVSQTSTGYLITFIGTLAGSTTVRTINAISVAAAAVVTTSAAHGYVTGDTVVISGTNSTPVIDGSRVVTVLSATTFSVPVTTSGSPGSAGSVYNTSQPSIAEDSNYVIQPFGNTGTLNLNTFALAKAFWGTTEDELTYSLQIKRTRTSGESKTIFGEDIVLKRELIDVGTLINVPTTGLNSLTLGAAGVATGTLLIKGTTSGTVTITTAAAAGTWTLTLPTNDGSASQVLTTDGNGVTSWATNGAVSSVGLTATSGLLSVSGSPITTSGTMTITVAGTSGGIPYFSASNGWASSGVLAASSIVVGGGAATAPSTITTGTGVLTALGVNTGSAGAMVLFNGAGGTPSSLTLTSATGLPISTGLLAGTTADLVIAVPDLFIQEDIATIYEDFIGGTNTDGSIGNLGWRIYSTAGTSAQTYISGELNHPGIFRIASGIVSGNGQQMCLAGSSVMTFGDPTSGALYERTIVRMNAATSVRMRLGFGNGTSAAATRFFGVRFDTTQGDTNFMAVAYNADGTENDAVSLGVAADTAWHKFDIERVSNTSIRARCDGGSWQTVSAEVPYSGLFLAPFFFIETQTAASRSLDIDTVKIQNTVTR